MTEIAERIGQIQAAASTAATVLASGGDLRAVQTGLNEIYEQVAQARRTANACTFCGGTWGEADTSASATLLPTTRRFGFSELSAKP